MARRPRLIMPTKAEEAAINRGIATDPDAPEMTDAEMAAMRPAAEVLGKRFVESAGKVHRDTDAAATMADARRHLSAHRRSKRGPA